MQIEQYNQHRKNTQVGASAAISNWVENDLRNEADLGTYRMKKIVRTRILKRSRLNAV